jgi:hypothetical protein
MRLTIGIETARKEIKEFVFEVRKRYGIPLCIADGILSSIIADIREETKAELLNDAKAVIDEKEEELKKAKAAAKRVLKTEPEDGFQEDDTGE